MLGFWLLFAALLAVAMFFLLRPLLRTPEAGRDVRELNLSIFQERRRELDQEKAAGTLSDEEYRGLLRDLERALLDDIPEQKKRAALNGERSPVSVWLWLLFVAVPSMTLGLYWYLGAPLPAERWVAAKSDSADLEGIVSAIDSAGEKRDPLAMQAAVLRLRALLMTEPDNIEAWYALGRTYIGLNQPGAGVAALERGYRQAPDDIGMMVGYAQGLILANNGQGTEESENLLQRVLGLNPKHEGALMLLGFSHFNAGEYQIAIDYWERLKSLRKTDSEGAKLLEQSIAEARNRLAQASSGTGVDVEVSLSEAMKSRVAPEDRVFVYARAADGPPMPLAVVTLNAKNLPAKVHLSDANAMVPTMKLSGAKKVIIGARVSKSGQAIPAPGDIEGALVEREHSQLSDPVAISLDRIHP